MPNLNEVELQNLKNFIEFQNINYEKLKNYSDYAVDPQIKQVFSKASQEALNTSQKLMSFLNP